MKKKAIVSGATGFIGRYLVHELLISGYSVIGLGRREAKKSDLFDDDSYDYISVDFDRIVNLNKMIDESGFDTFFHLAWDGGFTENISNYHLQMKNAIAVGDVTLAAAKLGCRKLVYAGTYNEYEIANTIIGNNKEPRRTCIYSAGKVAGDIIARTLSFDLGLDYSVGMIPMIYGEYNFSDQLINRVMHSFLCGKRISLVKGDNLYDLVYIKDIARALIAISERGKNQSAYYIGHRELKSFRDWIEDMRDILSPESELGFGEYEDKQAIDYSFIDLDALYSDTGFVCDSDFEKTLLSTYKWYREYCFAE